MNTSETINPYRTATALILRRALWDININSWSSRHKLRKLKDRNKDQKAVILCNGPSLLKSDLSLLDGTYTFGLNKINLLYDKHEYRPSCVVAVNAHVLEQNKKFYNETESPLFLASRALRHGIRDRKNIIYLHTTTLFSFAKNCGISVYEGATVTYVALQLAFHMGFKDVALIGCDHNFKTKGPANKLITAEGDDPNHFSPDYFSNGVYWNLPDLDTSEIAYMYANKVYKESGRRIYNATEGGKLEVFDRISLNDFLRG